MGATVIGCKGSTYIIPFFIASADSILKRHFHLIHDRKKNAVNTWFLFDDGTCQECQCCFCPPGVFWVSHLFLCYSASQSWVAATAVFSTQTHTRSPDWQIAGIYIYIYKISLSPNLNNQMSRLQCSQLHFCPEWNDEDQENQGKINSTLKKMHATSGHIVYIYKCISI